MIRVPGAYRVRTAVRFPVNSSHMCCVELALKELASARKGLWSTAISCLWDPVTAKQLFMAATASVIMAVRMRKVMARPWVGVCVPLAYFNGKPYSTFPAHVLVELLCGSQPTAPTCVVWTYRLIDCFALSSVARVFFFDVPARSRVGVCVPLALGLHYFQCFNALISLLVGT